MSSIWPRIGFALLIIASLTRQSIGQFVDPTGAGEPRTVDYPRDGVSLGNGWNGALGEKTATRCIKFKQFDNPAGTRNLNINRYDTRYSFLNSIDVSVEVQLHSFFDANASAKTKFTSELKIDQEESNFAVYAVVENGASYAGPDESGKILLTDEYEKLSNSDPKEFERQCGDSYVAAVFGGAELSALYTFHTYAVEEQKAITQMMQASGFNLFEANTSTTQKLIEYADKHQLTIFYTQSGGSGDPLPIDLAGITEKVQELPKLAKSAPFYAAIAIRRYDELPNWRRPKGSWLSEKYAHIVSQYSKMLSLRDLTQGMIHSSGNYNFDRGVSMADLQHTETELDSLVRGLNMVAQKCYETQGQGCSVDPSLAVSDYEFRIKLPVRKNSFVADTELENTKKELTTKQALLDHETEAARYRLSHGLGTSLTNEQREQMINMAVSARREEVQRLSDQVKQFEANYPKALHDAILEQWIVLPVLARCHADPVSVDCLNAEKVEELLSRIRVR